ncbi:MAG TPA: GntR family transcriptional regulator [Spirillospora sp.]|nr:GntR family transcriptional regulator [Spirillospora sp.]
MSPATPRYIEIARALQKRIESGELLPGDRLPTEHELAGEWNVSPNTAKQAMKELRRSGRVETLPHRGSFVSKESTPFVITLNDVDLDEDLPGRPGGGEGRAFVDEAERQGLRATSSLPRVSIAQATDAQKRALRLRGEPRPQIVRRTQQRFVDGRPNSLQHSYFALELALTAQALLAENEIAEGAVAYLRKHGHVQVGYEDGFDARPPTAEEMEFFGLPRDSLAVIEHSRTAFDQDGEPFRLTVTVYKPGANRIRFIAGDVPDGTRDPGP